MAAKIIKRIVSLDGPIPVDVLPGALYTGENGGHEFWIYGWRGTQALALSGAVTAQFVNENEETVPLTGSILDGAARVALPAECYHVPGKYRLTVFCALNGESSAVYRAEGRVASASTTTAYDPAGRLPDTAELAARIEAAVAAIPADYSELLGSIAHTFSTSTAYTVGQYVWYEGELYRFNAAHPAGAWIGTDAARYTATDELPLLRAKITEQAADFKETIGHSTPVASLFSDILLESREFTASGRTVKVKRNWASVRYVSSNANSRIYNLIAYDVKQVGIPNYVPDESTLIPVASIPASGMLVMRRSTQEKPAAYSSVNLIFCTVDNGTVTVVARKNVSTNSNKPFTRTYYNTEDIAATHVTLALATQKAASGMDVDLVFDIIPYGADFDQTAQDVEMLKTQTAHNEATVALLETHKAAQPLDANNQPTNGTAGQLLRTRGDGATEWADAGLPTDTQVAGAVSAWLNDHPGATTTVDFSVVKKIYSSLSAMASDQALAVGHVAQTLGYFAEGDGGGACVRIVSAQPAAGYSVAAANGYAALLPGDYLAPEMFGAYGDDTHDDAAAFNLACTWARYYGIPVRVGRKTYRIGATISVREQVRLTGCNTDACVLHYVGDGVCLDAFGSCAIDGVQIKSSSAGANTIGINVDSTEISSGGGTRKNINIKNCKILQFRKAAICLNNEWQVNIDNCRIEGYGRNKEGGECAGILFDYDGAVLSGWAGSGNLITNTYVKLCDYGIYNRGGWDVTVVNCIFEYVKYGIYKYEGGTPMTVVGCWFEQISTDGFGLYGKIFNVMGCRGDSTFDLSENTVYGILAIGSYTRFSNLVLYDANRVPYRLSVDTGGNVIATALS